MSGPLVILASNLHRLLSPQLVLPKPDTCVYENKTLMTDHPISEIQIRAYAYTAWSRKIHNMEYIAENKELVSIRYKSLQLIMQFMRFMRYARHTAIHNPAASNPRLLTLIIVRRRMKTPPIEMLPLLIDKASDEPVGAGGAILVVGVTSPSAVATPPKRLLLRAQTFLIPSTTLGRSGVLRMSD